MTDNRVKKGYRTPCLAVLLLGGWLLCAPGFAQENFEITLSDGVVVLRAENANLRQVLGQLAEQAEFKLWISEKLEPQPVNIAHSSRPLQDTLAQLLREYANAMVHNDAGEVTAVYVLPPGEAQSAGLELNPSDLNQQVIEQMLATESLPGTIQSALTHQINTSDAGSPPATAAQRSDAMLQILEQLQNVGVTSSTAILKLQEQLERETDLQ